MSIVSKENLQLNREEDYERAKRLYGDINQFPRIYEVLESSRKKRRMTTVMSDAAPVRPSREDGLFVREILRKDGEYQVIGEFNVITPSQSLTMSVDLYAKCNGELIELKKGDPVFSFGGTQKVVAGTSIPKKVGEGKEIVAILTGSQIVSPKREAVLTVVKENLGWIEASIPLLIDIEVDDPQSKRVPPEDHVYICYNRKVLAKEADDYFVPKNGSDDFYIPLKGKAYFRNYTDIFDKAVQPAVVGEEGEKEVRSELFLFARGAGGGRISYANTADSFVNAFTPFEEKDAHGAVVKRGFSWDFRETPWTRTNPFTVSEASDWDFSLVLMYRLRSGGGPHSMIIRSYSVPEYDAYLVPFMRIYWGCLYRNTDIAMADGSTKKIQDLLPGDRVQSEEGCLIVNDLIEGREERGILHIQADGRELYASEAHPIPTDQGIFTAFELLEHPEARIKTVTGPARVEAVTRYLFEDSRVYNLTLRKEDGGPVGDEGAAFYANGILVGDISMQRYAVELRERRRREEYGLTEDWRQDVEHAAQFYTIYREEDILWEDESGTRI